MAVPLIQGALRYAYKTDPAVSPAGTKERAEGWTFASSVLPLVAACNPVSAKLISRNMDYDSTDGMADGHASVYAAFRDAYTCMGLTCADIGGLNEGGGAVTALCDESSLLPAATDKISGYTPGSDVRQHARLDLDQVLMSTYMKAGDYNNAKSVYTNGKNSKKSNSMRTLAGLSDNNNKLKGEPLADMYAQYWGAYDYADTFVNIGFDTIGMDILARKELAVKGAAYQNVWMYVVHELEDAVQDCKGSSLTTNDNGVHAWDEGWAFYAGSLGGPGGASVYALAEKRCINFDTCVMGTAGVNIKLLDLFTQGKNLLFAGKCDEAKALITPIVSQMTVPLIQGALRYAYASDPAVGDSAPKGRAEGWAFSAAVLPQVDSVNSAAADIIRKNMDFNSRAYNADGYKAIFAAFQSVYEGLGITCEEVGGLEGAHACHGGSEGPAMEEEQEMRLVAMEKKLQAAMGTGSVVAVAGDNVGLWAVVVVNLLLTLMLVTFTLRQKFNNKVTHSRLGTDEPSKQIEV
jgi:hypothetical protein